MTTGLRSTHVDRINNLKVWAPAGIFAVDDVEYNVGATSMTAGPMITIVDDVLLPCGGARMRCNTPPPDDDLLDRWVRHGRAPGIDQFSSLCLLRSSHDA